MFMRKIIIIFFLCLTCQYYLHSQYNFNFERPIQINYNVPENWVIQSKNGISCEIPGIPSEGERCFCITKKDFTSPQKLYFIAQMIVNNNLQEIKNEVRCKIDLKGKFGKNDSLKVEIRIFEEDFTPIKEQTEYLNLSSLDDWEEYEVKLNISSRNIMHIFFDFTYYGHSDKVEMDNLRVFIDEKPFNNRENNIDSDMTDKIKKYCHPINNFDIEAANISHFFDSKKIVGVGENSHGCLEIQILRRNIIQYLTKTKNYKNIIIEDNYFRTNNLNLALHSDDTVRMHSGVEGLNYWVNRQQEMYKLIRNISSYKHINDINIYGCDFFLNKSFIELMSKGSSKSEEDVAKFKAHFGALDFIEISNSENSDRDWRIEKELFCSLYPNESLTTFDNQMLYKAFDYSVGRLIDKTSRFRDGGMYDMTKNIVENKGKSILMAHNGHIGYFKDRMGTLLKEHYSKDYVTIGFLFYEGKYAAMGPYEVEEFEFKAGDVTYESLFNRIPYDVFFIDLKGLAKDKQLMNKISPRYYHHIGALPEESVKFFDVINLEEKFDYLIFIKNINAIQF